MCLHVGHHLADIGDRQTWVGDQHQRHAGHFSDRCQIPERIEAEFGGSDAHGDALHSVQELNL
ncbi:hypothetical protein FQZ97_512490 [compost metagenome]